MSRYDKEIAEALRTARDLEKMSDASFAAGDPLHGSMYYRHAQLCWQRAENLAARQAHSLRERLDLLRG